MQRKHLALIWLLVMSTPLHPACAHDMWLVPANDAQAGRKVDLTVAVGMDFPDSVSAIDPARLTMQAHLGKHSISKLKLQRFEAQKRTIASFIPNSAGVWLVSGVTRPNRIELAANKFNDYLLHDGLQHILAGRMDRKELDRGAKEQYSKHTKALVFARQDGSSDLRPSGKAAAATVLGLKLEIVLLNDPFKARSGDTLKAQVLFEGKPLAKANLCWDHPGNGEAFSGQTLTDKQGRTLVPVAKSGLMTLRLIHMVRPQTKDYEWESFWSSFTFRIPQPAKR